MSSGNDCPPERAGDESEPLNLQEVSELLSAVCTRVCTSEPKTVHAELLESLAAALSGTLPADDCRRLAELLTRTPSEGNPERAAQLRAKG